MEHSLEPAPHILVFIALFLEITREEVTTEDRKLMEEGVDKLALIEVISENSAVLAPSDNTDSSLIERQYFILA